MVATFFYPVYMLLGFIIVVIFVPKKDLKEYFTYGVILRGLGDLVVVAIYQNLFQVMWFQNAGIFSVLGQNLLSPPSWILTIIIYLHFLPHRKVFMWVYTLAFAAFSVGYGYLVRNAGLFDFKPWLYPYLSFLTFLLWWVIITWLFCKTSTLRRDSLR